MAWKCFNHFTQSGSVPNVFSKLLPVVFEEACLTLICSGKKRVKFKNLDTDSRGEALSYLAWSSSYFDEDPRRLAVQLNL